VKILRYTIVGFAVGLTLSAHACTILEFGAENLLYPGQNTAEITFQELEAFAPSGFPSKPIFSGIVQFDANLNAPINLGTFGYAVVFYLPGTSGDPTLNRGGTLDFFVIRGANSCSFTFPQIGPGDTFSNGRISSVTLFNSESIPEAGTTVMLFAMALSVLGMVHRFAKS
jgi:hypothetical protein